MIRVLTPSKLSPLHVTTVVASLSEQFDTDVRHQAFPFSLESSLDRARGQHLAVALIRQMVTDSQPDEAEKLIGIVDVDLFAPALTFVFGEAQLSGPCAVLSSFRLRNEFYGIPPDAQVLEERIAKEAVHEVGHLYGLIHCRTFDCVMRSSTYVEEIDLKSSRICAACREKLGTVEILNNATLSGLRRGKNSHS